MPEAVAIPTVRQDSQAAAADIVAAMKRSGFRDASARRLASVCINGTFLEVLEAAEGSSCNGCPFALDSGMPHAQPVCCIPDYLACRAHIRFRIVETAKGVPS